MSPVFRKILVGVDPGRTAGGELKWANLLRRLGGEMLAAYVVDPRVLQELRSALGTRTEQIVADAEGALRSTIAQFIGSDCCETTVIIDEPAEGLLRIGRSCGADLLVVADPEQPVGRFSVGGGIVSRCIRQGNMDLMISPRESECSAPRRVLACVKQDDAGLHVLRQAAAIAAGLQAELHVLHAYDPPWRTLHYRSPTTQAAPDFRRQFTTLMNQHLTEWCAAGLPSGLTLPRLVYHLVEEHDPCAAVCDLATNVESDLIVVGSGHGHRLRDWWFGRTPERLVGQHLLPIYSVAANRATAARPLHERALVAPFAIEG